MDGKGYFNFKATFIPTLTDDLVLIIVVIFTAFNSKDIVLSFVHLHYSKMYPTMISAKIAR